ncbi:MULTISPECIES: class I SAM-dependent methyltransferase [Methylomicrobium]|uniref:Methylase involved in ubiquinone/menaquinone biosynthesis n=1 Tax=Methylomicrobium album BG8 TaxID=686340 RepID=H8GMK8_METAL|nr:MULTISPECIES: class I SAM-dependent methyltransferase [Methylomicrobium]EIC28248.1 methylase involved in ubiquinone/menaquinone biosynthesis [Methylomicrobium album BG8]
MNTMNPKHAAELLFEGPLAEEYGMLAVICPSAAEISRRVGEYVDGWMPPYPEASLNLLEIGSGTGITTACLLASRKVALVESVDNAPAMLAQARHNLAAALAAKRLRLIERDALSHLQATPDASVDAVVSAYTLHNFLYGYRQSVLKEILRVLKPGGLFVNGDRYALDDAAEHLKSTQAEVRHYFRVFTELKRHDLLEQWIVHLFSDESEEHIMRLQPALEMMADTGFANTRLHFRDGANALVSAVKPA